MVNIQTITPVHENSSQHLGGLYSVIIEAGMVGPRPKLPEFHMSGLATCLNTPDKDMNNGEGHRKEVC